MANRYPLIVDSSSENIKELPTGDAILFLDNEKIKVGTGSDLTLYHDASNSYITNAVGALKVATETSGIAVTIGHTTSETTIADNLTVTGTLTGTLATAAQPTITTVGTIGTGVWQGTAVASGYIAADAITGAKIADDAIDSEHYADGSIDNAHIADDAIDSEHYAAGSIDTAHIADDQITLAKMASGTDGNVISYDASGNPVAIATGSDGQVLTSTGAGSPPAFEAAGGGKVLQVSSAALGGTGLETTSSTPADMCTVTITPASSSNKVLILASNAQSYAVSNEPQGEVRVYSDLTSTYIGIISTYQGNGNIGYAGGGAISIEQSLSSWSSGSITYRLRGNSKNSVYIQLAAYGLATLTVMEISS